MQGKKRREEILSILKGKKEPISGTVLAAKLGVSRQIIVQDIAILRASGIDIIATPKGYLSPNGVNEGLIKIIACHHNRENTERELEIIVDNGGKVLDVIVEHSLYGEIKGLLMLNSRLDIKNFISQYEKTDNKPLSFLTGGTHLHTVNVPNENSFKKIILQLKEEGYLIDTE